jgi:hypothetical protein
VFDSILWPAASDYRFNDSPGDPLFVVNAEANVGLVKKLPGILDQVPVFAFFFGLLAIF